MTKIFTHSVEFTEIYYFSKNLVIAGRVFYHFLEKGCVIYGFTKIAYRRSGALLLQNINKFEQNKLIFEKLLLKNSAKTAENRNIGQKSAYRPKIGK